MVQSRPKFRPAVVALTLLPIAVVFVLVVLPNLVRQRIPSTWSSPRGVLEEYARAQGIFREKDRYGIGRHVFANPVNGTGAWDLYQIGGRGSGGEVIGLVDGYFSQILGSQPLCGYHYVDVPLDAGGKPLDYAREFALCAFPVRYGPGDLYTYLIHGTTDGWRIFCKVNRGQRLERLPADMHTWGLTDSSDYQEERGCAPSRGPGVP